MAWVARTWVEGDVVTVDHLNELSDNFNLLALHDHSGGSGSGTRSLGGSATGLITVYMRDGAGPGTPTGTISAVFSTGSRLAMLSSGGTVVLFATGGHEHITTQAQIVTVNQPATQGTGYGPEVFVYRINIPTSYTSSASSTLSTSITVGGSGSRAVFVGASVILSRNFATNDTTLGMQVLREGTVLGTHEIIPSSDPGGLFGLRFSTLIIPPTGSQTYLLRVKGSSVATPGAVSHWVGGALFVSEIRTP